MPLSDNEFYSYCDFYYTDILKFVRVHPIHYASTVEQVTYAMERILNE